MAAVLSQWLHRDLLRCADARTQLLLDEPRTKNYFPADKAKHAILRRLNSAGES